MKAFLMTPPKSRDDDSIHTYGWRVCVRAQFMLRCLVLAIAVAVSCGTLLAAGPEPVNLGTATNFGALAGAAITGSGNVEGDVGSGTGAIAPAITSTETIYPTGDAVVMTALDDFAAAYNEGKDRTHDILLSAAAYELGGTTLTPGVYKIGAAATLASPVTLDAEGDPYAVFVIQIVGALGTTASAGNVVLTNDAQSANVFWIVEGAVSMGASTHMEGTILGGAAITFGASTTINGRALAGSAAGTVALATTTISVPVEPSIVGNRVWFDSNGNGIQDLTKTNGISNVPVTLLQVVFDSLTIDLGTATNFGALAGAAITGSGNVEGDVGSGTGAIAPAITSTETIYPTGDAVVMTALDDFAAAYNEGKDRTHDVLLSAAAYELGGTTLTPGVYKIGAAATLASPVTLDAEGDPDAVFVIQIVGALGTTASAGNVVLTNDAQSANVFWIVEGAVSMGASTHMEGTILGGAAITFGASTTINGRALAGSAAGTVALATTVSSVTGTPPVGNPPPIVVADTVTDANGNYLFESVQPGTYIVRWDLSSVTNDFRITTAKQGGDDALDSDSLSGAVGGFVYAMEIEVLGGTTHLGVDLGLAETLSDTNWPTAIISNPETNDYVAGDVAVFGTANDESFWKYSLYAGAGVSPGVWTEIYTISNVVQYGTLGTWDSSGLGDQVIYSLKLEVFDKAGHITTNICSTVTVLDETLDFDSDGLTNGYEYANGSDLNDSDSDDDGLSDGDEVNTHSTNPLDTDTDDDGMPDGWEVNGSLNPLVDDSADDADSDNLNNGDEYTYGTLVNDPDTDNDGLLDGDEVNYGINPLDDGSGDSTAPANLPDNDYNDDNRSDLAVYDDASGSWYILSTTGDVLVWANQWGWSGAETVSGDYDGDGKSDLAVYDQNIGSWYILSVSGDLIAWAVQWGWTGADTVSGDYNGDGKSDLAVYDTNSGYWYIYSLDGSVIVWAQQWGWAGAETVSGDYDGDGKSDLAVYDQNTGSWYILSVAGDVIVWGTQWGWNGAETVPGDYNGDDKDDLAVYDQNTGLWYILSASGDLIAWAQQWGWPGAETVPGDYNGDGVSDLAVYDQNSGYWYVYSLDGTAIVWAQQWGWPGATTVGR